MKHRISVTLYMKAKTIFNTKCNHRQVYLLLYVNVIQISELKLRLVLNFENETKPNSQSATQT
jgi:hypothetical protein